MSSTGQRNSGLKDHTSHTNYIQQDSIEKKVGDLIFLTSNAGSKLGDQKHALKQQMERKIQRDKEISELRSSSPQNGNYKKQSISTNPPSFMLSPVKNGMPAEYQRLKTAPNGSITE